MVHEKILLLNKKICIFVIFKKMMKLENKKWMSEMWKIDTKE